MSENLSFDEWQREQKNVQLPPAPTTDHMVEVQHGSTTILRPRRALDKPYRPQEDPRLIVVTCNKHRHRCALLLHSYRHKGLPDVWKVKFLDKTNISTSAILDECELRRINKGGC